MQRRCSRGSDSSEQSLRLQADVSCLADDEVIVNRDAQPCSGVMEGAGDVDVGLARPRIAAGMVVDHAVKITQSIERARFCMT